MVISEVGYLRFDFKFAFLVPIEIDTFKRTGQANDIIIVIIC